MLADGDCMVKVVVFVPVELDVVAVAVDVELDVAAQHSHTSVEELRQIGDLVLTLQRLAGTWWDDGKTVIDKFLLTHCEAEPGTSTTRRCDGCSL